MKNDISAETLQFNPHIPVPFLMKRIYERQKHSFYKAALLINDLGLALLAFSACALLFSDDINLTGNITHAATLTVFALASIAFFKPSKLYNYHIIYDPAVHIKQLLLAFFWNIFILASAFLLYTYGNTVNDIQFVIGTLSITVLFLILRKYIEDYSIQVLSAIGISFIIVGWLGLLGQDATEAITGNREMLVIGFLTTVATVSLSRYLIVHQLFSRIMKKSFRRQTIIIGPNEQAEYITQYVVDKNTPFYIRGFVSVSSEYDKFLHMKKAKLGDLIDLPQIIEANQVNEVIVTDERIDKKTLVAILDYCAAQQINVWFPPNCMPVISVKLYMDHFCGIPMIRLGSQKNSWLFSKIKYALDALATLPIFLLQLPIFVPIAVAIKMTSEGPVFYRAKAIGKNGNSFTMYKFRSMRQDSDNTVHKDFVTRMIKGELTNDGDNSKVLKITNDDRVTAIGRIIRRYSLDELPQLINVLKGDMSLIGPRPCLPYEYEAYDDWHKKRTAIRPGISGLWQVTGRSEVSFEDMLLLDLYYVYNRSLLLDISILFETLFVVLRKKGAY
jgi:undecaprenyl-phosphate galactose phosphotransferase